MTLSTIAICDLVVLICTRTQDEHIASLQCMLTLCCGVAEHVSAYSRLWTFPLHVCIVLAHALHTCTL